MINSDPPVIKDLVLVGGGHAHISVLKSFGMHPLAGVRVSLISRETQSPYSGMLPGYIAGHYSFDETHIDLGPLSGFAGARFFNDEVIGLDTERRHLICRNRPDINYDVLSIDIGSTPRTSGIAGADDNAIPVKPIDGFLQNWQYFLEGIKNKKDRIKIGIVGAGAAGVELILAIQYRLEKEFNNKGRDKNDLEFHLFCDSDEILVTYNSRVRSKFVQVLQQRGINLHTGHKVTEVDELSIRCENGASVNLDQVFWATSAGAQSWLAEAGLDVDGQGFVNVKETLESVSHEGIFAVGDIANMLKHPRPKSGVFAVRQGPVLFRNLQRKLQHLPLQKYIPQKQFLSLISTGDQNAIASKSWWALEGSQIWNWKDWIDRRFMRKFNELPPMAYDEPIDLAEGLVSAAELTELSEDSMRCGGCGGKVGALILEDVLAQLQPLAHQNVLIGLDKPDDAAVISVPEGKMLVQSVDSFRTIVDDPYVFGQIAANHALGDIFAMGAEAHSALAIVNLPFGIEDKIKNDLLQMMLGAVEVLNDAGTALIGGHTAEAKELSLGFAVNGFVDKEQLLRKQGMVADEQLIITKALGTGTLFAAHMRLKAKGRWVQSALDNMIQSNREAARCLFEHGSSACTDVTGFGLLGHLLEMTKASAVNIELEIEKLPCLDGFIETLAEGIFSSLYPQNRQFQTGISNNASLMKHPLYPLLFDPQTAGGLLASVPRDKAQACLQTLRALGYADACIIGRVIPESRADAPITILS